MALYQSKIGKNPVMAAKILQRRESVGFDG
jgi:hypothetical protein